MVSERLEKRQVEPGGDLAAFAEKLLLRVWLKSPHKEAVKETLARMKTELVGPDPSPLERLLAERIVICWIQTYDHTIREALCENACQADYHAERQAKAQRMMLSAIKTLAQVRRLQAPNMQVNIAEKQINVQAGIGSSATYEGS